jgi:4-hydroxy-tetrahydrodipicolinate reductase
LEDRINIALIGYGKMGQAIAKNIAEPNSIKLVVDPQIKSGSALTVKGASKDLVLTSKISDTPKNILNNIDVFIEFTNPESALANIKEILKLKDNAKIVCGTTGWDLKSINEDLNKKQALLLHSSNFSLGINIISKAIAYITKDLKKLGNFEASMVEYHHKNKKDAPSGTAKTLASIMEEQNLACPVSSVRAGHYPGTHSICFDSKFETIEITHTARTRELFCSGILLSADWLSKQNKPGLYKFSDVIGA